MRTYTTVQGDMWDSIAHNVLGDVSYVDALMNLNLQYCEFFTFPAGIVLVLPEVLKKTMNEVPPWKKVVG